jgi:hypothetical protein
MKLVVDEQEYSDCQGAMTAGFAAADKNVDTTKLCAGGAQLAATSIRCANQDLETVPDNCSKNYTPQGDPTMKPWTWDSDTGRGAVLSTQCAFNYTDGTVSGPTVPLTYPNVKNTPLSPPLYSRESICFACLNLLAGGTPVNPGAAWCKGLDDPRKCFAGTTNNNKPLSTGNMDDWCWIRDPAKR